MSDLGAQAQRTGLAWRRTALAAAACALLLLHTAPGLTAAQCVAIGTAIALAIIGARRERQLRREGRPAAPSRLLIAAVAILVAATAVATALSFA